MSEKLLDHFNQVESTHWWWEGRRQLLYQLLAQQQTNKVLDIGCGTGETLTYLKKTFPNIKVYGVDQSAMAVKYAQSRRHKNVYRGNALKLPFKDNTFDAVLLLDVVEHIKDDVKALCEAKRVLKTTGVIIITSPALNFIWSDHDTNQGHQRRYTKSSLNELAKKCQLQVIYLGYFNFFLSPLIIPIRLLSRLKYFNHLSSYDSRVNFGISKVGPLNNFLKTLFTAEIRLLPILSYPIGISVGALLRKA